MHHVQFCSEVLALTFTREPTATLIKASAAKTTIAASATEATVQITIQYNDTI